LVEKWVLFFKKKKTICPYFPTTIMVTEIWADR
jgi:hypothetical protein